jgi:hypothetical protein
MGVPRIGVVNHVKAKLKFRGELKWQSFEPLQTEIPMATKAKPDYPWYQVVSRNEVTPGDILPNCPILTPAPEEIFLRVGQGADEVVEQR